MLERLQLPPWSPCPPLWSRRASWFGEVQLRRGQRRGSKKDAVGGEATGGVLSSPPAGRAAPEPRSPPGSGFLGLGRGTMPGCGAERGAGAGTGRKGGLVTRRDITNNFFPPSPGMPLLPKSPVSLCGASPAGRAATSPHGTGQPDSAPSGSPQGKGRSRERYAGLKPQHREPRQESRFGNKQPFSITTAGRNTA